MELNITRFVREAAPMDYSASESEIGLNAGAITWGHAVEDSQEYMLLNTEDKREAFRLYVAGFGAWDADEIAAWSDVELNALCLQFIAGDLREMGLEDGDVEGFDWEAYAERDDLSHGICCSANGEVYIYIGN